MFARFPGCPIPGWKLAPPADGKTSWDFSLIPSQFPSVSMVDWNTGKPNARLWVLKLLRENFGPGDKLVETEPFDSEVAPHLYSLAAVKPDGKRRILLVNKRDTIPGRLAARRTTWIRLPPLIHRLRQS
jgi:hypothetical protein